MPSDASTLVPTAPSTASEKLGQPVPLSNLAPDRKRRCPHPAQTNSPSRCSPSSGLVPGYSVSWRRSTAYCLGVSDACHASSVLVTANGSAGVVESLVMTSVLQKDGHGTTATMSATRTDRAS